MKKTVLTSVGCFLLCALTPAFAADMPIKAAPAPYVAPYYNWTGFYIGINGGYGFGQSKWTNPTTGVTTGNFDINGAVVGGTIGYNYQFGAFVAGIEGDFDWSGIKGSTSNAVCVTTCETKQSWLGTARARLGYAFDRWLPFITGGAAFGDVKSTSVTGSSTDTKVGWTAGAGIEWAFLPAWTAKIEYLYVDLGTATCDGACSAAAPIDVTFHTNLIRAGINYRF